MKFRPETLVHRVIIKPHIETKTESGLYVAVDERSQAVNSDRGIIVEIGPKAWKAFGCWRKPFKVGAKVYYAKYGAKVLKDAATGQLYIICNDEDVLVEYTND